jgi:sulfur carrier protein
MKLKVNGETVETAADSVAALLKELGIEQGRVAVEVNLTIVKKADYDGFGLKDGDTVEIVNFVGGGECLSREVPARLNSDIPPIFCMRGEKWKIS